MRRIDRPLLSAADHRRGRGRHRAGPVRSGAYGSPGRLMRRVLVTGAGGAVAGGVLEALIESGWHVAGLTRDGSPGSEHEGVAWFGAELTDAKAVRAAVGSVSDSLGGLDALVCLAGGFRMTPLDEASWSDFEQILALDFRSTVEAVLAAVPFLTS